MDISLTESMASLGLINHKELTDNSMIIRDHGLVVGQTKVYSKSIQSRFGTKPGKQSKIMNNE
jgi:hypothetical protein